MKKLDIFDEKNLKIISDKYEIIEFIGSGSYGKVYRG
jgi:serine/threonine protein kinase